MRLRPQRPPLRLLAAAALCAVAASLSGSDALAHGGDERPLGNVPPAPPGDGAKAEELLREIVARVAEAQKATAKPPAPPPGDGAAPADAAGDGAPAQPDAAPQAGGEGRPAVAGAAKVVAEPVEKAKRSLGRAHEARAAGDAAHARLLDGLALEWAETARDLLRAVDAEITAVGTAQRAREASTRLERARALLEETQARRGRAAAELERVEAGAREAAAAAARVEQDRVDASKRGGAKAGGKGDTKGRGKGEAPPKPKRAPAGQQGAR